jgi:hypothetical protein
MVYRGKPSAGCETCRKAKKKCTLELPACSRCVKLNKQCSGYRDTTGLQIQDETLSVTRKAERKNAPPFVASNPGPSQSKSQSTTPATRGQSDWDKLLPTSSKSVPVHVSPESPAPDPTWVDVALSRVVPQPAVTSERVASPCRSTRLSTPSTSFPPTTLRSRSTSSDEDANDSPPESDYYNAIVAKSDWNDTRRWEFNPYNVYGLMSIPKSPGPKPDDVAVSYFLNYFTADGHWDYLVRHASRPSLDPCLTLAIKACGMAALENVQYVPGGRAWCRKAYMKAIGLLNEALRDPVRSKKDESLMAVTMLSFFEVSCSCISSTSHKTDAWQRTSSVIANNLFSLGKHISQAPLSYSN